MRLLTLLCSCFFCVSLFSCLPSREYNSSKREYETVWRLVNFVRVKKKNRYLTFYPPAELSKHFINYRKRYQRWPYSLYEVYGESYNAKQLVEKMLSENYQSLLVTKSNRDTMEVSYVYESISKKDESKNNLYNLSALYNGKYVYIYKDSSVYIDNVTDVANK